MGDRANILVKDGPSQVYLYTHWSGQELPEILRQALIRGRNRWDDGQYLARIIFCEMVQGDILGESGYGISSKVQDGDDRILEVNTVTQTVRIATRSKRFGKFTEFSFADYITEPREWK